ncbi:MAG: hypothetical protein ACHQXA_03300 [Gemmatimonadales bacterium]
MTSSPAPALSLLLLLGAAGLAAQAPGLDPLPGALVPRSDSFVVLVRGTPLGYNRSAFTRTDQGFLYVNETQIGAFVLQRTEIALDRAGAVWQVLQGGQIQGINIRTSLEYRRGRVKGVTVAPSGGQAVSFIVDTVVPAGTVDDNAIPLYLPALAWGPQASWKFTAFVSGENTFRAMELSVIGTDTVSVPAGQFETWEAELRGGQAPVRFFVTKSVPHRVVREELVGTPVEFALVK